jgi:hypothetical protein
VNVKVQLILRERIIAKIEKLEDMLFEGDLKLEDKIRIKGMIQGLEWTYQIIEE